MMRIILVWLLFTLSFGAAMVLTPRQGPTTTGPWQTPPPTYSPSSNFSEATKSKGAIMEPATTTTLTIYPSAHYVYPVIGWTNAAGNGNPARCEYQRAFQCLAMCTPKSLNLILYYRGADDIRP
jgi:hypothetical protein